MVKNTKQQWAENLAIWQKEFEQLKSNKYLYKHEHGQAKYRQEYMRLTADIKKAKKNLAE